MRSADTNFDIGQFLFQQFGRLQGVQQVEGHDAHGHHVRFNFPHPLAQIGFRDILRRAVDEDRRFAGLSFVECRDIKQTKLGGVSVSFILNSAWGDNFSKAIWGKILVTVTMGFNGFQILSKNVG